MLKVMRAKVVNLLKIFHVVIMPFKLGEFLTKV